MTLHVKLLAGFLLLLLSAYSHGKCSPLDPPEYRYNCQSPYPQFPQYQVYGMKHCLKNGSSDQGNVGEEGFFISEKGFVTFFAPNIGAPNPHTFLKLFPINRGPKEPRDSYIIEEFVKSTLEKTGVSIQIHFDQWKRKLTIDSEVYSSDFCQK